MGDVGCARDDAPTPVAGDVEGASRGVVPESVGGKALACCRTHQNSNRRAARKGRYAELDATKGFAGSHRLLQKSGLPSFSLCRFWRIRPSLISGKTSAAPPH